MQPVSSLCSCAQGVCSEGAQQTEICTAVKSLRQQLSRLVSTVELLKNESEAGLRHISVENAKQKEEVDLLKKEQGRLQQNQSTLQKEKESLKETLTKRQDRDVSLLRYGLQRLQENVTMEQKGVNDRLTDQKRSTSRILFEVIQAKSALTKLETRYNTSERQLLTTITNLQREQVRVWLLFFSNS